MTGEGGRAFHSSCNRLKFSRDKIIFDNVLVYQVVSDKHYGIALDSKLKFDIYTELNIAKVSKAIGLIRNFQHVLSRSCFATILKDFVRPHLDHGEIFFNKLLMIPSTSK